MTNSTRTAVVTGANSGIGFEAAAQLAEAGFDHIVLACRTLVKAQDARARLVERLGSDPFETLVVDVSSIASAEAASAELIRRGVPIDALLLNAGMVSGEQMNHTEDGFEVAFASSIIGHHVMTVRLFDAGLLPKGSRVVIAGSEGARGDLPAMMDMKLYDWAAGTPSEFGDTVHDAIVSYARGERPELFNPFRYYAMTKLIVSWWSASMARRHGDSLAVFTVSPGSSMNTNAGRHTSGIKKFMFTKVMPVLGPYVGMSQSIPVAAKRYVDVLTGNGDYRNGATYMSAPKKLVGPLVEMTYPHMLDEQRQDTSWQVLTELTGAG